MYQTPKISTFNDSTKYQQLNDFFFQTFTNYTFSINSFIFFLLMILSTQFYSYISRNVSTFWFEFQISVIVRWRKTISVKSITLLNNSKVDSGHITACAVESRAQSRFLTGKRTRYSLCEFLVFSNSVLIRTRNALRVPEVFKSSNVFKKNIVEQEIASWCL